MIADEALDRYRDAILAQAVDGWTDDETQARKRKATKEARALVKSMMVPEIKPPSAAPPRRLDLRSVSVVEQNGNMGERHGP